MVLLSLNIKLHLFHYGNTTPIVSGVQVIDVKLRVVMAVYSEKYGKVITYQDIANVTGISRSTIEALGSRQNYNPTLSVINSLCQFFDCSISELLEFNKDE